jgi:TetR/AcrR family transcriptional regulator, repressor for uid operon
MVMRKTDPELHERRRDELLEAAEHCFIERGFHRATIQDIASAAGVSLGLMYRYYENKDAVILAVAEREREQTIELISGLSRADDFHAELVRMMRKLLRESTEPNYVRLSTELFAEACRNPVLAEAFSRSESSIRDAIIAAIRAQQKSKNVPASVDAAAVADVLISLSDGLGVRALLNPKFKLRPIENMLEPVINALLSKQ